MEQFNKSDILFGTVVDPHGKLLGTVEMHHVRAALLGNTDLNFPVETVMNKGPATVGEERELANLPEDFSGYVPVLDKAGKIKAVHLVQRKTRTESLSRKEYFKKIIVQPGATIKKVIKILDTINLNLVLVADEKNKFLGLVTERDIRDAILDGHDAETPVEKIMNKNPITGLQGLTKKALLRLVDSKIRLSKLKIPLALGEIKVPILDADNHLKDLAIHDELDPESTLFFVGDDEVIFKDKVKNVLITGGAGYIGSILCGKLLQKGYKVRVLDNLLYGDGPIRELYSNPNFELVKGDIRHIEEVVSAIGGMDAMVHLAAIVGDPACAIDSRFTIESNYLAAKLLADICKHHQINRFLFSSTCSVYGASPEKLSETSPLNPVSLYARSKIYSENAILEMVDENFSPTILRLGTVYGLSPRPRFDLVLNLFVAKAIKEGKFYVDGGNQFRPMVHVADVADGFVACLEAPIEKVRGEIFNIGSNEQNLRIEDLGKEVVRLIPTAEMVCSPGKTDARDYWVYFDKVKNAIAYEPRISIEEGIEELIEFIAKDQSLNYKDNRYSNYKFLSNLPAVESQYV
ncbi:MAG: NAD-dependent epimerase/dehydratase family protein [Nitrospinae bacterium]|nr:NAD-dependent epimerase/dehydratase family protein [Nitrospinota bacterium]